MSNLQFNKEGLLEFCQNVPNECDELKQWLTHILNCEFCQGFVEGFGERMLEKANEDNELGGTD